MDDITWSVEYVGDSVKSNTYECMMYGEDDEGNSYTGIAIVINPSLDPIWDVVTDIERED